MPCDITHWTNKKYYMRPSSVESYIEPSDQYTKSQDKNIFNAKSGYFQDTFIQLYNGSCYINLINGFFVKKVI